MLRFPQDSLRLLYWLFFKPFTLQQYVRSINLKLTDDLYIWEVRKEIKNDYKLRALNKLIWLLILCTPILFSIIGFILKFGGSNFTWWTIPTSQNFLFVGGLPFIIAFTLGTTISYGLCLTFNNGLLLSLFLSIPLGIITYLIMPIIAPFATFLGLSIGVGIALGLIFGVSFGINFGIGFGISCALMLSIVSENTSGPSNILTAAMIGGFIYGLIGNEQQVLFLNPLFSLVVAFHWGFQPALVFYSVWPLSFFMGYFRLPFYFIYQPITLLLFAIAKKAEKDKLYAILNYSPLYFDEVIQLPLISFDELLTLNYLSNREKIINDIIFFSEIPHQRRIIFKAIIEIISQSLEKSRNIKDISTLGKNIDWLPPQVSKQLTHELSTIYALSNQAVSITINPNVPIRIDQINLALRDIFEFHSKFNKEKRIQKRTIIIRLIYFLRSLDQLSSIDMQLAGFRLSSALSAWENIFSNELRQYEKQLSSTLIPNAYISGSPLVENSRIFKGRNDIFKLLELELSTQIEQFQTLLLFGPRRSGKTSTLRQLPSRLDSDFIPIEIDLLSATTSNDVIGLLQGIATQILEKTFLTRGIKFSDLPKKNLVSNPYPVFMDWLKDQENLIGHRLILLNLDEFERLEDMIAEGRLDTRIFQWLRSLIQNHPKVMLLLSGSHTLEELSPTWSDALINVRTLRIGPLRENEARELITAPIPDFPLKYDEDAVQTILLASGRKPYLIQAICRDLVNYLNEEKRRSATRADVEKAFAAVLQTAAAYFNEIWTSRDTDDEQRRVMRLLSMPDEPTIPENQLIQQANLPNTNALRKLTWRDVIEKTDDGYRLASPILGRWVRERAL